MALSDENNRISKISPSSNGRKTGFEPVNIRSSRIGEAKKGNYRDIKLFKNVLKGEHRVYTKKNNSTNKFLERRDDLYCRYCGKQCKNLNSLKQHECRCKLNPNKIKDTLSNRG